MFFSINQIELGVYRTDKFANPKVAGNPMQLRVFRTRSRTAFWTVHSKKAYGLFWDEITGKSIRRRLWSPEMKAFAQQKIAEAPKPPFIFKLTIFGWIFVVFLMGLFGMIIYEETKAPLPKPAEYVAMEQTPTVGDVYFGKYYLYKEKGNPLGVTLRFGWFRIEQINGDSYHIAPSTDMSEKLKPKEQLGDTDFEKETLAPVKLQELESYRIRFVSEDGLTEVDITDKK